MSISGVPDEFEELMPCPACPDGYVWNGNGPTCKPCPVCKGHAAVGYRAAQEAMPPREPTMAMLAAAQEYLEVRGETVPHDTRIGLWREMYYAWQEQTGGKAANVPRTQPDHAVTAGPLDHQSAIGTNCATEEGARPSPESARGPAADPITDLCAELRATHCSNENLHDNAAYELERLARERDDIRTMLQDTNLDAERFANIADKWKWQVRDTCIRAERAEAERDALRECVKAADAIRELYVDFRRSMLGRLENGGEVNVYDAARAEVVLP